ncbi:hypothetical protein BDF20DRAFT_814383 [Mycotypha africana]|uniref:uncharacterized protein n=1 Tax=Mycotypha africana TaxID=64632 RepID=UPI0022FFE86A|nr:uncharacterized protein BDF20DRAFT_814383 [Mycotypha africana]KAI8987377.1 hypothetical protein BDF20DRAFT_814383 [Mycotypha africana]
MSKLKRSGDVAMHCLPFRGLLEDDSHFLKFQLAINDSLLMGDIKADPKAKLSWIMPKTKEYYNITGKFYIASAPTQLTRFPPPKISSNDGQTTADYWEQQRLNEWNKLSSKARATFTWPSRAETPKSAFKSFNCQSLDKSQKSVLHEIALDNFCLLVFKVTDVEHLDYSCFPPKRTVCTCRVLNCVRQQVLTDFLCIIVIHSFSKS